MGQQHPDIADGLADFIRQQRIFDLCVDLVQTSCGMAVPVLAYQGERRQLVDWAVKKGPDGLRQYWREKNQTSLDGKPTHIAEKNL